jgi:hypothetical protein
MKIVKESGAMTLFLPWNASRTEVSMKPMTSSKQIEENDPEQHREGHRVDVDGEEITGALVPDPFAVATAHLQIGQVMLDVLAGRLRVTA